MRRPFEIQLSHKSLTNQSLRTNIEELEQFLRAEGPKSARFLSILRIYNPEVTDDPGEGVALLVWSSSGPSACVCSLIDFVKLGVAEELSFFTLPRVAESALAVISAVQECHGYPIPKLLRLLRTLSKGFQ